MIYLDRAATTEVRREVLEAMWPYLTGEFGNPSSSHSLGATAARALADARSRVARVLGARPGDIVFTSGGSESDTLAIVGIALANPRGRHVVTTAIEHPAVLESCAHLARIHGFEVTVLPVGPDGLLDLGALEAAGRPDTTLVSVMYANNEVGTVQDIAAIARIAHGSGALVHSDAVQAPGWLPLDVQELGVDALSLSGHKVGAPKGIGALFVRGRIPLEPVIHGGGQERGRRSGTENLAGAVGLATGLEIVDRHRTEAAPTVTRVRDAFIDDVLASVPDARLTGSPTHRLPGSASFTFPTTSGEAVLLELERAGILCSSGSACAAGSDEPSHVLVALGIAPEVAQTAVRFSFDETVSRAELAEVAIAVRDAVRTVAAGGAPPAR
ncbi:aminotransferase class V-fold PLP-dependent enzyme [Galbitalea soli]|uniref:cysteine desulfurase n=1 Tax=Galbitalea soli TaxID=1268042 RepID=A0A7C9PL69_9MICO|nr:cysteine desulfurase [Galbitalea soli]NYJ30572.1 cysteine desulfurase [Galbitalea soli]